MPQGVLIRELVVDASEDALNHALFEHKVSPSKIVAVMLQPAPPAAGDDNKPKYRVIYSL